MLVLTYSPVPPRTTFPRPWPTRARSLQAPSADSGVPGAAAVARSAASGSAPDTSRPASRPSRARDQFGIHRRHLFGDQTVVRRVLCVVLVGEGHGPELKNLLALAAHRGDVP